MKNRVAALPLAPLPIRDGVSPSYLWLPEGPWEDLQSFLAERFAAIPIQIWRERMARGEVVDGDGRPLHPDTPYRRGIRMFYYREIEAETPIPFDEHVVYRDDHILVADKPHFLPTTPSGRFLQETLLVRLKKKLGLEHLVPLHRLDRETAGLVLFSHNPESRGAYQAMFRERAITKEYEALAPIADAVFPLIRRSRMEPGEPFFCMREVEGEPNAETWIDLVEKRDGAARYRLKPVTGKQHQLRVHMAALGAPILNDAFYPVALPCKGDDVSQPLQLLARTLSFLDPINGQSRSFASMRELCWSRV